MARNLLATSEEMAATLMRTAFSPNIKERADCSTAIFDRHGEVTALAQRIPMHLGSMVGAVAEIRKRYQLAEIRPGDMFMANDPYNGGGTHLPDITVIAPVFVDERIVAFVANIAHHADVGGMVPGSEAANCALRSPIRSSGVRELSSTKSSTSRLILPPSMMRTGGMRTPSWKIEVQTAASEPGTMPPTSA